MLVTSLFDGVVLLWSVVPFSCYSFLNERRFSLRATSRVEPISIWQQALNSKSICNFYERNFGESFLEYVPSSPILTHVVYTCLPHFNKLYHEICGISFCALV